MTSDNHDFLKKFFAGEARGTASGLGRDSKFTIQHDKWDDSDYQAMHAEIKEFNVAEKQLKKVAEELAPAAMADEFWTLVKAVPMLKPESAVRPSHKVNSVVMAEQMKLHAYEALRAHSVGDTIGTALATVTMEPHLEVLYDKLKKEQELAKELDKQMGEYEQQQTEQQQLQDLIDQAGEGSQEAADYQKQMGAIEDGMAALREAIEAGNEALAQEMAGQSPMIRKQLTRALQEANKEAEESDSLGIAWGLEAGGLKRLDPGQRIRLAEKMRSEKFKRLAELIGPMMRLAWGEQKKKVNIVPEEVFDVELGNNVSHMLPLEYIYLNHPVLRMDWMRKYTERGLMQYKLRGVDKVARGGIIVCEDGSGSMHGAPEVWSKATSLALLHIAKSQKRPFTAIHFGGVGEYKSFEFDTTGKQFKSHTKWGKVEEDFEGVDAVIDFAEMGMNGGTDFVTPLSRALDQLQAEHAKYGAVKGDIVFITDGICGVPAGWLKTFKEEQERLQFKVFGIVIGGSKKSEPLWTICDGRVAEIKDLTSGNEIREMFGEM